MTQHPQELPILATERVLLRPLVGTDAIGIYQYASDPDVTPFLQWETHQSMEDTLEFLAKVLQTYDDGMPGTWGIEWKENNTIIGTIGFHHWRTLHDAVEIGYVIGKPYWGAGIMTEAVKAALGYLFNDLHMNRVEAICCVEHFASERVMQKVGMRMEGVMRNSYRIKGAYRDMKLYAILQDEWFAQQGHGA